MNIKKQIITAVILSSLSVSAFAVPSVNLQAEGGGDRTHERQQERMRIAEGGGDRTHDRQKARMRIAEGGGDRTHERQTNLIRTT